MKNRVIGRYFLLGMLGLFFLCFIGGLGQVNGQEISVWSAMTKASRTFQLQNSSPSVYTRGFNQWFVMLLPIAVSFPTISLFCDEHIYQYDFFILNRIGLRRYVRKSFWAALGCGMLLVVSALLLYALVIGTQFPLRADFGNIQIVGRENDILGAELWSSVVITVSYVFWAGAVTGVAYLFASIGNNIYVNVTMPFLFNYILFNYVEQNVLMWAALTILLTYGVSAQIWKYKGRMYGA